MAHDRSNQDQGMTRDACEALASSVSPAVVLDLDEEASRVRVRLLNNGTQVGARIAVFASYRATQGDRVLVASDGEDAYVVGVLHAARAAGAGDAIELPDGACAHVVDGALELRDPAGELLLRYADGHAELTTPHGDLVLAAPRGKICLKAATNVEIEAVRDVTHRAGRRVDTRVGEHAQPQLRIGQGATEIHSERLDVVAQTSDLKTGRATIVAQGIATTARTLACTVERYDLKAERIVEKARDAFRDVTGLLQSRVGRARTMVDDVYALYSRRTVMVSKEDTSVDGERILLG